MGDCVYCNENGFDCDCHYEKEISELQSVATEYTEVIRKLNKELTDMAETVKKARIDNAFLRSVINDDRDDVHRRYVALKAQYEIDKEILDDYVSNEYGEEGE